MIGNRTPTNFLRHVYSESVTDIANIVTAEAEDKYDVIIGYLHTVRNVCGEWIKDLEKEKEYANSKKTDKSDDRET